MSRGFDTIGGQAFALLWQGETAIDTSKFDSGASLLWMLVQTILVLVFVCALAYVVIRILPRHGGLISSNSMVKIVDRAPLDQRRSLYVIKVAGRWLLIGSSEAGVQLISELDPETAEQEAEAAYRERPRLGAARMIFSDRLSQIMKKRDK